MIHRLQLVPILAVLFGAAAAQDDPRSAADAPPDPGPRPVEVPPPLALVGGIVHAQDGSAPAPGTVIVRDGRIEAVGADLEVPDDVETIDVTGLHVVPGLIDGAISHDVEHDALYVAHGVTLARDTGNRMAILGERRAPERARVPGPDLFVAGPVIDGPQSATTEALRLGDPAQVKPSFEALRNRLREMAAEHGLPEDAYALDYVSLHRGLAPEVWREVVGVAHAHGFEVWGPSPGGVDLATTLEVGQDGLFGLDALLPPGQGWLEVKGEALAGAVARLAGRSDAEEDGPEDSTEDSTEDGPEDSTADETAGPRAAITPLLMNYAKRLGAASTTDELLRQLSPYYEENWLADRARTEAYLATPENRERLERASDRMAAALLALWKAGVPLVPGSGAPHPGLFPGAGLVDELELWVRAGIPPGEVLRLATAGAADVLGVAERRGRVRPGLVADLVVLGADPRSTLASLRDPELVVLRGTLLERDQLFGMVEATIEFQDAARQLLAQPIEAELPDFDELAGATLLAEGRAENQAFGRRISAERFGAWTLADGRRAYATRVVTPASLQIPELHIQLLQVFKGDLLDEFRLLAQPQLDQVAEEDRDRYLVWEVRGGLIESTGLMTIQRGTQQGRLPTLPAPDPVSLVDFSDAMTAMILGRHVREGKVFALKVVGQTYEPVVDLWAFGIDPETRTLQFAAKSGERAAFQLDAGGIPTSFRRRTGSGMTEIAMGEVRVTAAGAALAPLPEARVAVAARPVEAAGEKDEAAQAGGGGEARDK